MVMVQLSVTGAVILILKMIYQPSVTSYPEYSLLWRKSHIINIEEVKLRSQEVLVIQADLESPNLDTKPIVTRTEAWPWANILHAIVNEPLVLTVLTSVTMSTLAHSVVKKRQILPVRPWALRKVAHWKTRSGTPSLLLAEAMSCCRGTPNTLGFTASWNMLCQVRGRSMINLDQRVITFKYELVSSSAQYSYWLSLHGYVAVGWLQNLILCEFRG